MTMKTRTTMKTKTSARLEAAQEYLQKGFQPVPFTSGEKKPVLRDWQNLQITEANIQDYFGDDGNIGIRFGTASGGLCDVDLDAPEAVSLAPSFLPPTEAIFGRRSKRESHWLYFCDLHESEEKAVLKWQESGGATVVELRIGGGGKGAVSMVPPSTHPSGEPVRWFREGEPARVNGQELKRAVELLACAALLLKHYPAVTARHEGAIVLGGVLARGGWSAEDISNVVTVVAEAAGDEEARERAKTAADAVGLIERNEPCPGLPRFGEELVRGIRPG